MFHYGGDNQDGRVGRLNSHSPTGAPVGCTYLQSNNYLQSNYENDLKMSRKDFPQVRYKQKAQQICRRGRDVVKSGLTLLS